MRIKPTSSWHPVLWAHAIIITGFVSSEIVISQEGKNADTFGAAILNTEKNTAGFLKPTDSLKALKLPAGFAATLFAAEPDIRQPIAATTDAKGRLWVCENYTYSDSKVNFDLNLNDRIVILEDQDNDGAFDKRVVFWDQGKRLTSVALGFGGVYVACAPNLLFIPDRDQDDQPDGPAEVLLDGWNDDAVRHNIVNGLMWGPDGWLYGRHGIMATSFVGKPGASRSQRIAINCGIWRFHPIHRKFEVVAHGTTNPWGMDYNNNGDLFMINTVIGHFWHVVPGARYDRMYGSHFNPYTYHTIQQTADHYHWNKSGGESWSDTKKIGVTSETDRLGGGHAHCGLLYYGDDTWPEKYRDTIFTCNLLGHRINNDRIEKKGNGFVGKHNPDFAKTSDHWFRGIELVRSHDQGFYLLDWQDSGECHENDGVHRTSGRIYKVVYGKNQLVAPDLDLLDNETLVGLLSRDRWHFEKASMVLRRRMAESVPQKSEIVNLARQARDGPTPMGTTGRNVEMFRTMCAGDQGADALYGEKGLENKLRQLTTEDLRNPGARTRQREFMTVWSNEVVLRNRQRLDADDFSKLAREATPAFRQLIASGLRLLEPRTRLSTAKALVLRPEDKIDNMQSLLIWYGVEPLVVQFPQLSSELAQISRLPEVSELIARRLAEEIEREKIAGALIQLIARSGKETRGRVLEGVAAGLKGRKKISKPAGWDRLMEKLNLTTEEQKITQTIALVLGDGQTLDQVRKIAEDKQADPRMRGQAFLTLGENRVDGLFELLNQYFGDREVRHYIIEAYGYCDQDSVGRKILNQYRALKPAGKSAAVNTLTKRVNWADQLLNAIAGKRVDKSHLTAWHARQIENLGKADLTAKLEKIWGTVRKTSAEKIKEIEDLKSLISTFNPEREALLAGKKIFEKSCANCHVLFGQGGTIGPDLTGGNRKDLSYLLENIVDPNSSVADTFRSSILELVDGRTLTGVVTRKTPSVIEIQTAEKREIFDRNDIQRVQTTKNSLMPEGLLNTLTREQKQSLLYYLMSE
ncbi:MAG: PVC-type heme-binding CxxCH protein [Planctomycetota bacterium]|nr:PVC-type heme-binding CxxCH protein [Planctomycetota bacterium]